MKVSLASLLVMKDALHGSLRMHDRGMIYSYDHDTRKAVAAQLEAFVNSVSVDLEVEEPAESP